MATFGVRHEILPAVAAIIFDEGGNVLLQKRKDRSKWCIISGHIEFGESVEDAVIREIFEETNVVGEIVRFIGIYSLPVYQTYHFADRKSQYVTAYFEARLSTSVTPHFSNHETESLKYFPVTELPEDMDLINPYWLQDALAKDVPAFIR